MIQGKQVYTTSLIIAESLQMEHAKLIRALYRQEKLEVFKTLKKRVIANPAKGRPRLVILFTELQAMVFVSLMDNSPLVIEFKIKLAEAFIKYRMIASQQMINNQNMAWQQARQDGKHTRRECTDTIKEFIEYAIRQGSKSASLYYVNLAKMQLKGLFLLEQKFPNVREFLTMKQLNLLNMADEAIRLSLDEGMSKNMNYKDIYKLARDKIAALAKIFPPAPLALTYVNENDYDN